MSIAAYVLFCVVTVLVTLVLWFIIETTFESVQVMLSLQVLVGIIAIGLLIRRGRMALNSMVESVHTPQTDFGEAKMRQRNVVWGTAPGSMLLIASQLNSYMGWLVLTPIVNQMVIILSILLVLVGGYIGYGWSFNGHNDSELDD